MTSAWFDWLSWIAGMCIYIGVHLLLLAFGFLTIEVVASLVERRRRRRTSGE